jgi:hypothetical protein
MLASKVAMVSMIASMVFIVAFPTLASAKTGYSGNIQAFATDRNQVLVPIDELITLAYIIRDGWRVGLNGEQPVDSKSKSFFPSVNVK